MSQVIQRKEVACLFHSSVFVSPVIQVLCLMPGLLKHNTGESTKAPYTLVSMCIAWDRKRQILLQ